MDMKYQYILSAFCFLFLSSCASKPTLFTREFKVSVSSIPDGAEVQLNGFYYGKTPLNLTSNTNSGDFIYVRKVGFVGQRIPMNRNQKEINVQLIKE
jgi:hypothetical protein